MTLERVECSIARIIDQVEALETGVPTMDQDKVSNDTHDDDHDKEDEVEEVEDEEPFNPPPRPPPHRKHRDDQQVHQELPRPHRSPNQQHAHGNDDPFAKVKFMIPPFYGLYDAEAYLDWEMAIDNKFSSHLVLEQHRVR
jgi:hypothetical protein